MHWITTGSDSTILHWHRWIMKQRKFRVKTPQSGIPHVNLCFEGTSDIQFFDCSIGEAWMKGLSVVVELQPQLFLEPTSGCFVTGFDCYQRIKVRYCKGCWGDVDRWYWWWILILKRYRQFVKLTGFEGCCKSKEMRWSQFDQIFGSFVADAESPT